ncbi:MAG TPA: stage II sporulation protein D [Syntrophomonadaceae bacterium]|nr:stage II sporulation protein D [Syntrophomonadaceae bacterium]
MKKKQIFILLSLGLIFILILLGVKSCHRAKPIGQAQVSLFLSGENRVIKLDLEDYLVGCVAAEMPSSFEIEALKAQAVCARTYAIKKIIDGHPYPKKADLSDDINSCQAYITENEFYERHPYQSKKLYNKVKKAVTDTKGVIMLYAGMPIDALYHSTCGGRTASAEETWGNELAYLQSKSCPYCKASKYYETRQVFSYQDFSSIGQVNLTPKQKIIISKNKSGRSKEVSIGDYKISTIKIRGILNLPSSWIKNIFLDRDELIVTTCGYGHGVGLCQCGANGLAQEGKDYKEILKYYYSQIQIFKIDT